MLNDNIVLMSISREDLKNLISEVIRSEFSKRKEKEILNAKEVCELLNIHPSTLASWKREGKLRFKKKGKRVFYFRSEILADLEDSNFNKLKNIIK
jgi:hypothetical protein